MDDFLYNRRKQLGYTLEQVGEKVGVRKSTVRKWEKGMIENMGRDNIIALSKALQISPNDLLGINELELPDDITKIYTKLEHPRQTKVYNFAKSELEDQELDSLIEKYTPIYIQSKLSAGTGIIDLDPNHAEEIQYNGYIPKHDLAFMVKGVSMEPLFEDGEIIFVEKKADIRSGQVIAVQINEEAYIKKAYIENDHLRLVSLNKNYEDIVAYGDDDIRIVGRIIL